jgi:hypothetical protein
VGGGYTADAHAWAGVLPTPTVARVSLLDLPVPTKLGTEIGSTPVKSMTTLSPDRIYEALKKGKKKAPADPGEQMHATNGRA